MFYVHSQVVFSITDELAWRLGGTFGLEAFSTESAIGISKGDEPWSTGRRPLKFMYKA